MSCATDPSRPEHLTTCKRDIGMIVPATDMPKDLDYDPAQSDKLKPHLNDPNGAPTPLVEGELVICKDDKDAERFT